MYMNENSNALMKTIIKLIKRLNLAYASVVKFKTDKNVKLSISKFFATDFAKMEKIIHIREYANELFCIFGLYTKRQCRSCNLE